MKSVVQFKNLTSIEREKNLKSRATKAARDELKKEIAKIMVAAEECGDFGKNEMNSWAIKATGIELRREVQGTYEYANVLRGIRSGELPFAEAEFDKAPSFGLIKLAGFMGKKDPEKVSAALEIIRSKKDVTNRLRELTAKPKAETPKEPESKEPKSKESAPSESGSLNSDTPDTPDTPETPETPEVPGQTYFVPDGMAILNQPDLVRAIVDEIAVCDCQENLVAYLELFKNFSAHVESRWEKLEAEAAAPVESKQLAVA
jgi:hypothetical protein